MLSVVLIKDSVGINKGHIEETRGKEERQREIDVGMNR